MINANDSRLTPYEREIAAMRGDGATKRSSTRPAWVGLAFRVSYMLDALRLITAETVRIEMNGELDPFLIAGPRGQSLVMPQRF